MPRYIDADAYEQKLADKNIFFPALFKNELDDMPTADVVPRSEVKMLEAEIRGYSVALEYDAEHFTADIKKLQLENATLIKNRDMLLQNYAMKIFDGLDKIFADYGLEYFNSNLKRQIDDFKKNITEGE